MSSHTARLKLAHIKGFPDFENDKIRTESFIEASNEVILIIDQFGKLFYPIVADMRNNSNQLMEFYQKDVERNKYIEDLILFDESQSTHTWLLWLKRALQMIERFFWHLLNNTDIINQKSDNLQPMIATAYDEVLKPYHGFFLQRTFSVLYRLMPSRKTLLGSDEFFNENLNSLRLLRPRMEMHIEKVDKFLKENGFDDSRKV